MLNTTPSMPIGTAVTIDGVVISIDSARDVFVDDSMIVTQSPAPTSIASSPRTFNPRNSTLAASGFESGVQSSSSIARASRGLLPTSVQPLGSIYTSILTAGTPNSLPYPSATGTVPSKERLSSSGWNPLTGKTGSRTSAAPTSVNESWPPYPLTGGIVASISGPSSIGRSPLNGKTESGFPVASGAMSIGGSAPVYPKSTGSFHALGTGGFRHAAGEREPEQGLGPGSASRYDQASGILYLTTGTVATSSGGSVTISGTNKPQNTTPNPSTTASLVASSALSASMAPVLMPISQAPSVASSTLPVGPYLATSSFDNVQTPSVGTNIHGSPSTIAGLATSPVESVMISSTQASGGDGGGNSGGVAGGGIVGGVGGVGGLGGLPGSGSGGAEPGSEGPEDENNDNKTASQQQQSSMRTTGSAISTAPTSSSASMTHTTLPLSSLASISNASISHSSSAAATSSCSDCDACQTYDYSPDATPNPLDNFDDVMKRELAGRFYNGKRRAGNEVTARAVASGSCSVSLYTQRPDYPGPGFVANNEPPATPPSNMVAFYATATFWAVPTQPAQCNSAPGWDFLNTPEIVAAKPQGYKLGGKGKSVNIDHVYEVSILNEFFVDELAAGSTTCGEISLLFDVPDGSTGGTRLNTVFAQLPSYGNPDFVGMDAALNRLKGSFWNPGLDGIGASPNNANAYRNALADLAVIMSMANHPKISSLFEQTNARIYQAFKGIDNIISQDSICTQEFPYSVALYGAEQTGAPLSGASEFMTTASINSAYVDPATEAPASAASPSPTWASAYSKWILGKIASQNNLITNTASVYSAAIPTEWTSGIKAAPKVISAYSLFISNFNNAYTIADLAFPTPALWPDTPINIQKRQATCHKTQAPASTIPYSVILYGATATTPITPPPRTAIASPLLSPTSLPSQCPNGATDPPECVAPPIGYACPSGSGFDCPPPVAQSVIDCPDSSFTCSSSHLISGTASKAAPSQVVQTMSIARSPQHASLVDIPCKTYSDCIGVVCDVDSAAVCSGPTGTTVFSPGFGACSCVPEA